MGEPGGSEMMGSQRGRYSPEFKEAAVREVIDNSRTIAEVARSLGVIEQTLGNWVKAYRDAHAGDEPDLTVSERARLQQLEREVRELKMENEFLGKSVAFFAKKHR
jgi:transposase-like protein